MTLAQGVCETHDRKEKAMKFGGSSIKTRDNSWIKSENQKTVRPEPEKAWDGGTMQKKAQTRKRILENDKKHQAN